MGDGSEGRGDRCAQIEGVDVSDDAALTHGRTTSPRSIASIARIEGAGVCLDGHAICGRRHPETQSQEREGARSMSPP